MTDLTATAVQIIHRQLGAITAGQLSDAGVGAKARRRLLKDRVIEPLGRSVYRVVGLPPTFESRLVMLSLQHPTGFVTGPTGGAVLGLRRMPRASKLHFCMPHGTRFDPPNFVHLRQSNLIRPGDVRNLESGMTVANWPRLAFDLGADLSPFDLGSVIDQMIAEHGRPLEEFVAVGRDLCGPRRPGSETFARALALRHEGPPTESHPELVVLNGLQRRGVPVVPQVKDLELHNGKSIRIDMAVPRARWAVEVDVHSSHLGLVGTTFDKQRDRQLHLIGWQVERVTRIDLLDVKGTLDELELLYRRRCLDLKL